MVLVRGVQQDEDQIEPGQQRTSHSRGTQRTHLILKACYGSRIAPKKTNNDFACCVLFKHINLMFDVVKQTKYAYKLLDL